LQIIEMPAPRFIYHIVLIADWLKQKDDETYFPSGFDDDGFIHCSRLEQLNATIKRFYKTKKDKDLRVLRIDTTQLNVPLIYEAAEDGSGFFPHVFGRISAQAITEVIESPFKFP